MLLCCLIGLWKANELPSCQRSWKYWDTALLCIIFLTCFPIRKKKFYFPAFFSSSGVARCLYKHQILASGKSNAEPASYLGILKVPVHRPWWKKIIPQVCSKQLLTSIVLVSLRLDLLQLGSIWMSLSIFRESEESLSYLSAKYS